jgi:hypothetical protein
VADLRELRQVLRDHDGVLGAARNRDQQRLEGGITGSPVMVREVEVVIDASGEDVEKKASVPPWRDDVVAEQEREANEKRKATDRARPAELRGA